MCAAVSAAPVALPQQPVYETSLETRSDLVKLRTEGVSLLDLGVEAKAVCDAVCGDLASIYTDPAVNRIQDAGRISSAVRDLAAHPTVMSFLGDAFGRRAFPFQTLNFIRGSEQSAHMDAVFFDSEPPRFMAGVWFALEDVHADAGPVFYYPGSHAWWSSGSKALASASPGTGDEYECGRLHDRTLRSAITERDAKPRLAVLRKGQALVWAANLAHGGSAVADPARTRKSLVVHYYFEGCAYTTPVRARRTRAFVRLPLDVRTNRPRWPRRSGRLILPDVRSLLGAVGRMVRPRPKVFRDPRRVGDGALV